MVSPSDVDLCVVQKESVQTFGRKVIPPALWIVEEDVWRAFLLLQWPLSESEDCRVVCLQLGDQRTPVLFDSRVMCAQKNAVAVAYVKRGTGLLKLNGEQT